ncbi:MAG: FlgD immunoglobulin-like domain containing protein, partial [Elusimicrobiota bacterium]
KMYPNDWMGEIHDDSLIVSGALWDLRAAIETTPQSKGVIKNLLRDALFYFPDSFESLYEALIAVSAGRYDASITQVFINHGIGSWAISGADSWESNDGFAAAKAMSSTASVKATIYPGGDVDYYRFVAGAGPVKITLNRPLDTASPSYLYFAYGFQIFDINRQVVGSAMPASVIELPSPTVPGKNNSFVGDASASVTVDLTAPKLLYVSVSAPLAWGSNDFTNSTLPYELSALFSKPINAISAGPVSAVITDQRTIRFSAVDLTGFEADQATEAVIDHIDVLDQNLTMLTDASGAFLALALSSILPGKLEGTVTLPVTFFDRYPSVGTISLEVFVRNALGNIYSLGFSNPLKIFTETAKFAAFNNIFSPIKSQKATLQYAGLGAGRYRLAIYTANGDLVKVLVDRSEDAGITSIDWDGKNGSGETVASGVYLAHLEGPGISKTQKIVVVK